MNNQVFGHSRIFASTEADAIRVKSAALARFARQQRIEVFGDAGRDTPWDILLFLYINYSNIDIKISAMHAEVRQPSTTVLRWLKYLDANGFTFRRSHPTDGRIFYVTLTSVGKATLDLYFDKVGSSDTLRKWA